MQKQTNLQLLLNYYELYESGTVVNKRGQAWIQDTWDVDENMYIDTLSNRQQWVDQCKYLKKENKLEMLFLSPCHGMCG